MYIPRQEVKRIVGAGIGHRRVIINNGSDIGPSQDVSSLQSKAKDLTAKALARVVERTTKGLCPKQAAIAAIRARARKFLNRSNVVHGSGYQVAAY